MRTLQRSALCRSPRELSNEYLLAKFGFDPAENELSKVCRSKQAIPTPGHKSGSVHAGLGHELADAFVELVDAFAHIINAIDHRIRPRFQQQTNYLALI